MDQTENTENSEVQQQDAAMCNDQSCDVPNK